MDSSRRNEKHAKLLKDKRVPAKQRNRQDQRNPVMDFFLFDRRGYPVVSVERGYAEWAGSYDATVAVGLDRPLLDSLTSIGWRHVCSAADWACGTGRTGVWLRQKGVRTIHGVDATEQMLDIARSKQVYERLQLADVAATQLESGLYDLCTLVLADEHLAELDGAYREAARLLTPWGAFCLDWIPPFFSHARNADALPSRPGRSHINPLLRSLVQRTLPSRQESRSEPCGSSGVRD